MSDTTRNNDALDSRGELNAQHVSPEQVSGAHDADGTMGRVAGTGSGAISGGIVGGAVGGPIGAVVGAVAGAALGAAGGNAAHKVGDDQDDVNVDTGSGGDLGKNAGAGAGSISGAILGSTGGPVGAVAGAVAGGMLGAAAGNAAKDIGGDGNPSVDAGNASYAETNYAGTPGAVSHDVSLPLPPVNNDVARTRSADETIRVPVVEEDINVAKHTQQAGEVAVAKHVVQEQVNVPVQVTHEEVTINRVPVDRPLSATDRIVDEGDVIRVPVTEEVVTVDKEARVVEEIEIRKHAVTEQEVVSDTVRREVVDVDDTTHTTNTGLTGHNTDTSGGRVL